MANAENDAIGTKKRIVKTAVRLIKEKGFENVTLRDICGGADISKQTFYYYFTSKDDVFEDFDYMPKDISTDTIMKLIETDSYFEQFMQLIEPVADLIIKDGVEIARRMMIKQLIKKACAFSDPCTGDEYTEILKSIIKKAQAANEIMNTSDPGELIRCHHKMIMGVIFHWCVNDGDFDLKTAIRSFSATMLCWQGKE